MWASPDTTRCYALGGPGLPADLCALIRNQRLVLTGTVERSTTGWEPGGQLRCRRPSTMASAIVSPLPWPCHLRHQPLCGLSAQAQLKVVALECLH